MIVNEFDENKHPRNEKGMFTNKNKVFTGENYQEFHKLFHEDSDKKGYTYIKKEKGDSFYVDEKINDKQSRLTTKTFKGLDTLLTSKDKLSIKIPNKKVRGKDEFIEDTKSLEEFKKYGFEVKAQYNDGYETNYVLEKKQNEEANNKDLLEKIKKVDFNKFKPVDFYIDWGKQEKQGKRTNKMITGAMGDVTLQGKKKYTNYLGGFSDTEQEEVRKLFREKHEQELYTRAREYGLNQEKAEKFVLSIFNSYKIQENRINLGKKY